MPLLRRNADRAIGSKREDRRHHRWPLHELRHRPTDSALDLQTLIRWVAGAPLSMKAAKGAATMAAPLIYTKQPLDEYGPIASSGRRRYTPQPPRPAPPP